MLIMIGSWKKDEEREKNRERKREIGREKQSDLKPHWCH
jgi:hypothetical protein